MLYLKDRSLLAMGKSPADLWSLELPLDGRTGVKVMLGAQGLLAIATSGEKGGRITNRRVKDRIWYST